MHLRINVDLFVMRVNLLRYNLPGSSAIKELQRVADVCAPAKHLSPTCATQVFLMRILPEEVPNILVQGTAVLALHDVCELLCFLQVHVKLDIHRATMLHVVQVLQRSGRCDENAGVRNLGKPPRGILDAHCQIVLVDHFGPSQLFACMDVNPAKKYLPLSL